MAKIVGFRYQEGIGKKSGKPYSAVLVSYVEEFAARDKGYGYQAAEMFVNRAEFDAATAGRDEKGILNADFDYSYDSNGFLKFFTLKAPAQAPKA